MGSLQLKYFVAHKILSCNSSFGVFFFFFKYYQTCYRIIIFLRINLKILCLPHDEMQLSLQGMGFGACFLYAEIYELLN